MRPSVLRGCFQPINSAFSAPTLTKKLTNTPPFAPPPPNQPTATRPVHARCRAERLSSGFRRRRRSVRTSAATPPEPPSSTRRSAPERSLAPLWKRWEKVGSGRPPINQLEEGKTNWTTAIQTGRVAGIDLVSSTCPIHILSNLDDLGFLLQFRCWCFRCVVLADSSHLRWL